MPGKPGETTTEETLLAFRVKVASTMAAGVLAIIGATFVVPLLILGTAQGPVSGSVPLPSGNRFPVAPTTSPVTVTGPSEATPTGTVLPSHTRRPPTATPGPGATSPPTQPPPVVATLESVSCPPTLQTGVTLSCTVTLSGPAHADLSIGIATEGPGSLTAPSTVAVSSGSTSHNFNVTAGTELGQVTVTASLSGVSRSSQPIVVEASAALPPTTDEPPAPGEEPPGTVPEPPVEPPGTATEPPAPTAPAEPSW